MVQSTAQNMPLRENNVVLPPLQIALDLLIGDANIAQGNLRMRMIEDILQLGNVFELLVMPIPKRFA